MFTSGYALLTVLWVAAVTSAVLSALLYTAALEARATLEEIQHTLATPRGNLAMIRAARVLGGPLHDQLRQELLAYNTSPDPAQLQALAARLQSSSDQQLCAQEIRIHFGSLACGQPLPSGVSLSNDPPEELSQGLRRLPFVVVAALSAQRQITQYGEFRLRVGSQPITRYALLGQGDPPPFTSEVFLGGPVWINGFPRFEGQPLFSDGFASTGCRRLQPNCMTWQQSQAQFGTSWLAPINLSPGSAAPCYSESCPVFAGGVDWGTTPPQWPQDNRPLAVARPTTGPQGMVVEGTVEAINLSTLNGTTRIQICQSRCNTYTLRQNDGTPRLDGPNELLITPFSGVIYVNGSIRNLSGAQPAYAPISLTLAAQGDITLTSSLVAISPPCSEPYSRQGSRFRAARCPTVQPVLGLYSHSGQIWLDATLPITLHAALLIRSGGLAWKSRAGSLWLTGSLATTSLDQWPKNLTYPPFLASNPPPGFPVLPQVRESWLLFSP